MIEHEPEELETSISDESQPDELVASSQAVDVLELDSKSKLNTNDEAVEKEVHPAQLGLLGTDTHSQEEMHFAVVDGQPINDVPKDLYIPPDALEVFLEAFEGPLDLLLYLIRRQNVDILNIPIAHITEQYMEYVEIMKNINFELAAEYLVMAAMLAEIKSRVLLPRPKTDEEDDDPRADLIRRLQEYERFKKAAVDIDELPRMEKDVFQASAELPDLNVERPLADVEMRDILMALKDVLVRAEMFTSHHIQKETLSTREKMAHVLAILSADGFTDFVSLFIPEEGRMGIVVTFLAIMELAKESLVELVQSEPFAPIHVRARIS
jgi:segregation and condensation protein A